MPRLSSTSLAKGTPSPRERGTGFVVAVLALGVACIVMLAANGSLIPTAASLGDSSDPGAALSDKVDSTRGLATYPEYSLRWRIGFGVDRSTGHVTEYDVGQLCAGWYHDWGTWLNPPQPEGLEFIQTIRVAERHFDLQHPATYAWADLDRKIQANPGAVWIIGNEPDGRAPGACDTRSPTDYAQVYKIFYDHIKGVDPTAKVSNGPIIQGTPLRMEYLTKVWSAYLSLYGTQWPVDVWNKHNQIVKERPSEGADIPLDCNPALGMNYGVQDNDNLNLFIDHVVRMRQWMKDHGQQAKPLIISEYGVIQPEYEGFTEDRISEYLNATFTYLLYATDPALGMPADDHRLVQRWNWFSLNVPMGVLGQEGWNGNLIDPETLQITEVGRAFSRWACSQTHPSPTPKTTPRSGTVRREAEGGSAHGTIVKLELGSASDCRYVRGPGGEVIYNVYIPNTGDYVIWGRGWGIDWSNWTYSVQVDDYPLDVLRYGFGGWNWQKGPMTYYLEGGRWHRIGLGPRSGGMARMDLLVITGDMSYNPAYDPSIFQVCNPTATPTPTVTRTPTNTPTPTITRTPMPIGPAKITGQVAFQGRGDPPSESWRSPLLVSAHLPSDPIPAYAFDVDSDDQGHFQVSTGVFTGTYDVGVRSPHSLRNLRQDVDVSVDTPHLDMGTLIEGDANGDGKINILDFSLLASCYGSSEGEGDYNAAADFNGDGTVNILDFSLLASNYGDQGDQVQGIVDVRAKGLEGSQTLATVNVSVYPSAKTAVPGQQFTIDVNVSSGSNQFDAMEAWLTFNPTYLTALSIQAGPTLPLVISSIGSGVIEYDSGTTGGTVNGSFLLYRVTFRAEQPVSSTPLGYSKVQAVLDGNPVNTGATGGTVTILAATATPIATTVPTPTATETKEAGAQELILQQGLDGYIGFEDTYIDDWDRESNFHTNDMLKLRAPNVRRILLRADLTMLAPGTIIDEAVLTLYQSSGSPNSIGSKLYRVARDWVLEETTWLSATQPILWDVAGCDGVGTDRASDVSYERTIFPTWGSYPEYPFDFDVSELVQGWVNVPVANNGLLIISIDGTAAGFSFISSDNLLKPLARPKLTIRYREGGTPEPTNTPTPTVTPTSDATDGVIQGLVFADTNANRDPDPGEPGVPGATIELRSDSDPLFSETRVTGPDGRYAFTALSPDTYRVRLMALPPDFEDPDPATWLYPLGPGETFDIDFPVRCTSYNVTIPLILRDSG